MMWSRLFVASRSEFPSEEKKKTKPKALAL